MHVRDEVGLGVVDLAVARARARDVEVAQRGDPEAVRAPVPARRRLERALRLAVDVDRAERSVLGDRARFRLAVHGRGRGDHEPPDARVAHRVQERDSAGHVLAEVQRRLAHGLADERSRRGVEDGLDAVGGEDARHEHPVAVAPANELGPRAGQRPGCPRPPLSSTDDLVPGLDQVLDRDRADVAGTAGDQDAHGRKGSLRQPRRRNRSTIAATTIDARPAAGRRPPRAGRAAGAAAAGAAAGQRAPPRPPPAVAARLELVGELTEQPPGSRLVVVDVQRTLREVARLVRRPSPLRHACQADDRDGVARIRAGNLREQAVRELQVAPVERRLGGEQPLDHPSSASIDSASRSSVARSLSFGSAITLSSRASRIAPEVRAGRQLRAPP